VEQNTLRPRHALALLLAASLAACGGGQPQPAPIKVEGLSSIEVRAADASEGRGWDGVVEAVRQAKLSAQTSGRVAQVEADVDDRVAAGQVLLRLTAVEQQAGVDAARAQVRAAEAAAREAELDYRRHADLAQGQYVSRAQLDRARAARDTAVAARDAARAQLASAGQQGSYTLVRAPYAGIVSSRDVEPGESVNPGQPLMTVFAPDALRVEVSVPQSEADAIRADAVARLQLDDGRQVDAAQVTVFPAADAATHAVKVRVLLPVLEAAPVPGNTVRVVFPAVKGGAYPQIPDSALLRRGEVDAVYVLADGRPSLRQLRLGERRGDQVEVIAGLAAGERIAADPLAAMQALAAARGER